MKLFYCFNGLYDYEYEIGIEDVINAIYQKFDYIIEVKAVDFYFKNYNHIICECFEAKAYWEFLQDTRCDLLDEKLMKKYRRAIREENKMLYGRTR
jgi:hypothetical protein